ncbi:MAG: hypothetical protein K2J95_01195 [Lachnospiraceae bacterium]|nr:hypothetical protein [Lachnospiraceae bacterium]
MYKKYKKYTATKWEKIEEKRHAKDPNHFRYARLKIYAPEESDLHEITLTYIKKLDNNGAWDFDVQHIDNENLNIVTFKWNGGVCALDAIAELHFHCEHTIKSEWNIEP